MDPKHIPHYIGGECQDNLTDMPGTFSKAYQEAYQNGELLPRNINELDVFYGHVNPTYQKEFSKSLREIDLKEIKEFDEGKLFEYEKDLKLEIVDGLDTKSVESKDSNEDKYNFKDSGVHSGSMVRKLSCKIFQTHSQKIPTRRKSRFKF